MSLTLDGTSGMTLPTWTTAARPSSPSNGQMGLNTTLGSIEYYSTSSSAWTPINQITGYTAQILIVAGGGGGGGGE